MSRFPSLLKPIKKQRLLLWKARTDFTFFFFMILHIFSLHKIFSENRENQPHPRYCFAATTVAHWAPSWSSTEQTARWKTKGWAEQPRAVHKELQRHKCGSPQEKHPDSSQQAPVCQQSCSHDSDQLRSIFLFTNSRGINKCNLAKMNGKGPHKSWKS